MLHSKSMTDLMNAKITGVVEMEAVTLIIMSTNVCVRETTLDEAALFLLLLNGRILNFKSLYLAAL